MLSAKTERDKERYTLKLMPSFTLRIVLAGVAIITPLLLWGLIGIAVRKNPRLLATIYPWLMALSVITYFVAVALCLLYLRRLSPEMRMAWTLAFMFSGGIQLVRGWAKRRVDPVGGSPDGWWPTKRDF